MVLVCYIYYFKYILLDIIRALLTILYKEHASSILGSIFMCTDCQHVEIIQTKSLTRLTNLGFFLFLFFCLICSINDNCKTHFLS